MIPLPWLVGVKLAVLALVLSYTYSHAHDSPMQGLKNRAGELCCGAGDCFTVSPVQVTSGGFMIEISKELVPFAEAQPSPDGQYWRCRKPDGSRRCFFAPEPSM